MREAAVQHSGLGPDQVRVFSNLLGPSQTASHVSNPGVTGSADEWKEFVSDCLNNGFSGNFSGHITSMVEAEMAYNAYLRSGQKDAPDWTKDSTFPTTAADDRCYASQMAHAIICMKDTWEGRKAQEKKNMMSNSGEGTTASTATGEAVHDEQPSSSSGLKRKAGPENQGTGAPTKRPKRSGNLTVAESVLLDLKSSLEQRFCAATGQGMPSDIEIVMMAWQILVSSPECWVHDLG